jgi:hypothetical protein
VKSRVESRTGAVALVIVSLPRAVGLLSALPVSIRFYPAHCNRDFSPTDAQYAQPGLPTKVRHSLYRGQQSPAQGRQSKKR